MPVHALFTIGYQGVTLDVVLERLKRARVTRILDVRALPLSRRAGFSKVSLAKALAAHGIEYMHLRACGNPYRALKNQRNLCLSLYAEHLRRHPEVLDSLEAALANARAALLCFEGEASECHRGILVEALVGRRRRLSVRHL